MCRSTEMHSHLNEENDGRRRKWEQVSSSHGGGPTPITIRPVVHKPCTSNARTTQVLRRQRTQRLGPGMGLDMKTGLLVATWNVA